MIDAMTKKPLYVSTDGTAGPYIMVPVSQLAHLRELLEKYRIRYSVEEDAISLDGDWRSRLLILVVGRMLLPFRLSLTASGDRSRMGWPCPMISGLFVIKFSRTSRRLTTTTPTQRSLGESSTRSLRLVTLIAIRNMTTGTVTTQTELAAKVRGYVTEQLTEATFQQFVSIFENFYFDILRLWLTAYPHSLGKKMVDFKTILELPDKDAITGLVVRKKPNQVLYDRPTEWFAYLEDKAKLGCPTADEIEHIAVAKASRDVLVHNRGIANKNYESKAGKLARFQVSDRISIPEHYHRGRPGY